jgi:hypothetical protein
LGAFLGAGLGLGAIVFLSWFGHVPILLFRTLSIPLFCARLFCAEPKSQEMPMKDLMTTGELIHGLKHYRRIAKQDLLGVGVATSEVFRQHAEARREIYGMLAERAKITSSDDVINYALELYESLPLVSGIPLEHQPHIHGQESALENFFVMVNLEKGRRRDSRKRRKRLELLMSA